MYIIYRAEKELNQSWQMNFLFEKSIKHSGNPFMEQVEWLIRLQFTILSRLENVKIVKIFQATNHALLHASSYWVRCQEIYKSL